MQSDIPILVLGEDAPDLPGSAALPTRFKASVLSVAKLDGDELLTSLREAVESLQQLADSLPRESSAYEIEHLDFSLGVSKNGKVGILSTLDVSKGLQATITVRLKKK